LSELRYDALHRRWVIITTERNHRPREFYPHREQVWSDDECPFCPGRENQTPNEIVAVRPDGSKPNSPDWRIRVTQKKLPALDTCEITWKPGAEGFYELLPGFGVHEIIIEGPDHNMSMHEFPPDLIFDVLDMYRNRLAFHIENLNLKYTLIFKNHGSTTGVSLAHPHSQVIGSPITPRSMRIELMSTLRYYAETGNCMICDMIERERREDKRLIYDDGTIVVFNSFAARFPYEFIIAPVQHSAYYFREDDKTLHCLAAAMRNILQLLKTTLNDPPFNYMVHSGPNTEAAPIFPGYWKTLENDFHWHIEIIPQIVQTAGFEWGGGLPINPVSPEDAVSFLKNYQT